MSKVRVVIATTEGPAEIDRITPEDAAQSVVCLRRSSQVLPISAGYDAFVRRPSGVIDREFPRAVPGVYRLDLAAPVTNGESWQLGVFIAHALVAAGRLAASGERSDRVIVATGRIDNDLHVLPVDQASEKSSALRVWVEEQRKRGNDIRLLAPRRNVDEFIRAGLPGDALVGVDTAWTACAAVGIGPPARNRAVRPPRGRRIGRILAVMAGLALPGAGAAIWGPETEWWPTFITFIARTPFVAPTGPASTNKAVSAVIAEPVASGTPISGPTRSEPETGFPASRPTYEIPVGDHGVLRIFALVGTPGATCPQVHMGAAAPAALAVPMAAPQALEASQQRTVCGLRFTVTSAAPAYLALAIRVVAGRYVEVTAKPDALEGDIPLVGARSWEINLPPYQTFRYELIVAAGDRPLGGRARRIASGQEAATGSVNAVVVRLRHEVAP